MHDRIAGEIVDSLAYMELVRNAVRDGNDRWRSCPQFIEAEHGTTRTQRELRWKVKHRYPNLFSLSMVGMKLLAEEARAMLLRRGVAAAMDRSAAHGIRPVATAEAVSDSARRRMRAVSAIRVRRSTRRESRQEISATATSAAVIPSA